jgi:acid stress-induced BolA-like protein IbaG/YrbA
MTKSRIKTIIIPVLNDEDVDVEGFEASTTAEWIDGELVSVPTYD